MSRTYGKAQDLIDFTRASSATYLDSDGLLKTASNNIPRIEYDANGNLLGLLVEESRTNLVKYSEPDSRSTSNTVGEWRFDELDPATKITNVSGPDGQTDSARECVLQSTIFDAYVFQVPVTSGNKYTVSAYVKLGTASNFALTLNNGLTWNSVTDGAKTFTTSDGLNTETFTRISLTFTAPSTNAVNVHIGGHAGSNPAQDAGTVIVYGFQLEAGEFATSLIPTSGSAVTRSADVASLSTSAFGYRQDEGTVVVDVTDSSPDPNGATLAINNGSVTHSILNYWKTDTNKIRARIYTDSVQQVGLEYTTDITASHKLAFAFKENDFAASLDGSSAITDAIGIMPQVVPTVLNIGAEIAGSSRIANGHIKSVKYYPRRLTNAQLQELTS